MTLQPELRMQWCGLSSLGLLFVVIYLLCSALHYLLGGISMEPDAFWGENSPCAHFPCGAELISWPGRQVDQCLNLFAPCYAKTLPAANKVIAIFIPTGCVHYVSGE